jgi:maltodextrin utilization protein YvdJ
LAKERRSIDVKPEIDKLIEPKTRIPKYSELKVEIYRVPQTWYGRLFAAIAVVLFLWLAVMFFTVFLIVAGLGGCPRID